MLFLSYSKQQDDDSKTPTSATTTTNSSGKKKGSKHHKVHAIPIAEDANCPPASYRYRVKMKDGTLQLVNANTLRLKQCSHSMFVTSFCCFYSRRKGVLTQDKVKFFLKAVLYKTNLDNRAPLRVKVSSSIVYVH